MPVSASSNSCGDLAATCARLVKPRAKSASATEKRSGCGTTAASRTSSSIVVTRPSSHCRATASPGNSAAATSSTAPSRWARTQAAPNPKGAPARTAYALVKRLSGSPAGVRISGGAAGPGTVDGGTVTAMAKNLRTSPMKAWTRSSSEPGRVQSGRSAGKVGSPRSSCSHWWVSVAATAGASATASAARIFALSRMPSAGSV